MARVIIAGQPDFAAHWQNYGVKNLRGSAGESITRFTGIITDSSAGLYGTSLSIADAIVQAWQPRRSAAAPFA